VQMADLVMQRSGRAQREPKGTREAGEGWLFVVKSGMSSAVAPHAHPGELSERRYEGDIGQGRVRNLWCFVATFMCRASEVLAPQAAKVFPPDECLHSKS
jgi:hypothetical protein